MQLRADGTWYRVRSSGPNNPVSQGTIDFWNGTLVFRCGSEYAEAWHADGDKIRLQHWYPASSYPDDPAKETGNVTPVE
jgi:hypothetical protein